MAAFLEELWSSIFTPGPTPTLLVATNATFAALQLLLMALLIATYNLHFLVLSLLSGGLWYGINWFAHELQAEKLKEENRDLAQREKSPDLGSETETEDVAPSARSTQAALSAAAASLQPRPLVGEDILRQRLSIGDSSGYVSTDSEWEKVSEADEKSK